MENSIILRTSEIYIWIGHSFSTDFSERQSPGKFVKREFLDLTTRGLGWGLEISISYQFLGDADIAGLVTTLWEPLLQYVSQVLAGQWLKERLSEKVGEDF